jgi:methyl-accepting chemotaxis protein
MSHSNILLLDSARRARERAAKARQLSQGVLDPQTLVRLENYALALEARATELEQMAEKLGRTIDKTRRLTQEVRDAVEALQQTVAKLKDEK